MLSIKQAASRPRPPWPNAASGSASRSRFRSTPRSPERRPKRLSPTQIEECIGKKSTYEELQRQIVDALAALGMAGAIHREPAMDNAVSYSQRGRDEPVSLRGYRRILAYIRRQFGEHGALDFLKVAIFCWLGSRSRRERMLRLC
jgi:hypothetical protein